MDSTFTKSQILGLFAVFFVLTVGVQWFLVREWAPAAYESVVDNAASLANETAANVQSGAVTPIPYHLGQVVKVSENNIAVVPVGKTSIAPLNLSVSSKTTVEDGNPKSKEERALLIQAYADTYASNPKQPFPNLFKSTSALSVSDLKPGDQIIFYTTDKISTEVQKVSVTRVVRIPAE